MDENTTPVAEEGAEETGSVTEAEVLSTLGKEPVGTTEEPVVEEETTKEEPVEEPAKEEPTTEGKPVETAKEEAPAPVTEAPTFTIEVEDANGKKFTVGPDDNLEEALADFEPKNNGQVLQLMRDLDRLGNERKSFEESETERVAQEENQKVITGLHETWDKEVQKLQGEKRLPLDGKIEDRKGEVFSYMMEENAIRDKEGRPLLQSFEDALDKLELKEAKEAKVNEAKEEKERNKQRGALVGGSGAPATPSAAVYRPGSARNANEALRDAGLLK
jgi:hypothetical protein